jgi:spore germination cell wall hydrolase CwlJ-like protein
MQGDAMTQTVLKRRKRRNWRLEARQYRLACLILAGFVACTLYWSKQQDEQISQLGSQVKVISDDLESARKEADYYHSIIQDQHRKEDEAKSAKQRKIDFIASEVKCLADNIYNEAAFEPEQGQLAVATVTMNRVANKFYPKTVCDTVYQRAVSKNNGKIVCQFSWTCKPRVTIHPSVYKPILEMAKQVYFKHERLDEVADALLYRADYIKDPDWADPNNLVATIGHHEFYKQ